MAGTIAQMQAAVRTINSAQPGYDQDQRWTFYDKGDAIPNKECDCSSVCGAIIQMGGYPIDLSGTFYTGNFNEKAVAAGFTKIRFNSVSDVQVGDCINAPGAHVEFAYSDSQWYSARNDEKGGSTGGKAGDQGGQENVGYGDPYDMSKGGSRDAYILRPPDSNGGIIGMTTVEKFTRTRPQTVPADSAWHELRVDDEDTLSIVAGPQAVYLVLTAVCVEGEPGSAVRLCYQSVDDYADDTATRLVGTYAVTDLVVGEDGTVCGEVMWTNDLGGGTEGATRKVRLNACCDTAQVSIETLDVRLLT